MKNSVQILVNFGLDNDWKDLTYGDLIKSDIPTLIIYNMEEAIRVVKQNKIKNVQLRQDSLGSTMEWDNF
jgi:hypothetical protein